MVVTICEIIDEFFENYINFDRSLLGNQTTFNRTPMGNAILDAFLMKRQK